MNISSSEANSSRATGLLNLSGIGTYLRKLNLSLETVYSCFFVE